jgi:hypothetical protein
MSAWPFGVMERIDQSAPSNTYHFGSVPGDQLGTPVGYP